MFPRYDDVTSRITEDPIWYTIEGYPRYGEFKYAECSIYAYYSILMLIECQDCGKEFHIGQDFDHMNLFEFLIIDDENQKELWVQPRYSIFAKSVKDKDGKAIVRKTSLEDLVKNWGFGDPPNHGCVGDTMGSIERKSIQVWDVRYGKKVEEGLIKAMGVPTRIPELEGLDLTPEWAKND